MLRQQYVKNLIGLLLVDFECIIIKLNRNMATDRNGDKGFEMQKIKMRCGKQGTRKIKPKQKTGVNMRM